MALGILGGPSVIGSLGQGLEEFREEMHLQESAAEGQGSEALLYPWLKASTDTKTQQQILNAFLSSKGYATITADGKLGPATCGAMKFATTIGGGHLAPFGTCQSFGAAPKCIKAPCLTGPAPAPSPTPVYVPKPVSPAAYVPPAKAKTSTANMLMVGGAVAGIAVVGYYVAKKKGYIK